MSIYFNGTDQYAFNNTPPPIRGYGTNGVTISAWFNPAAITANPDNIVTFGQQAVGTSTINNFVIRMDGTTGKVAAVAANGTSPTPATSSGAVTINNWYHVTGVFTSNVSRRVVLDGVWETVPGVNPNTNDRTPGAFTDMVVGAYSNIASGAPSNDVEGYIAHVAVWNTVLSQAQIESLAGFNGAVKANPASVQFGNLVGYWPMTDSDNAGVDVINGYNLTLAGGAVYSANNPVVEPSKILLRWQVG